MPNPSEIKASQVNYELNSSVYAVSNTAQLTTANNWVKNVASVSSSTNFKYGRLRWGLNFPGLSQTGLAVNFSTPYAESSWMSVSNSILTNQSAELDASAACTLYLWANGTLQTVSSGASVYGYTSTFSRTWLTSGSNSDYTVQITVDSGSWSTGDSINTDLALSTNRNWSVSASRSSPGLDQKDALGNLIIKSSGTEIFRRQYNFSAIVEMQNF